ncbi:uncharacterized protein LOC134661632, partial [Cydia amplana]|uniref:uncharacterized protein LOC134661632 n=1 Tax=Cydia amplana TaxID=1869771 RepID=UPI002FE56DDB
RSNILLLHGVPEAQDEVVVETVTSICQDKLQLQGISESSFIVCHRLGKSMSKKKPRAVLIKFVCLRTRNAVWSAKKLLKGSGYTVSEFLTGARHAVFVEARRVYGVKGSWTSDGKRVVVCPDGSRRKITTLAELQALPTPSGVAASSEQSQERPGVPPQSSAAGATPAGGASAQVLPRPNWAARKNPADLWSR